jgi:allophanate hydrolase subunit 2
MTAVGGYQGKALASGDFLGLVSDLQQIKDDAELRLPDHLVPKYPEHWELSSMVGLYDEGYLKQENIDMLYDTTRTTSHNTAHGGIASSDPNRGGREAMAAKVEHTQVMSLNTATRPAHSTGQAMIHASSHWTAQISAALCPVLRS